MSSYAEYLKKKERENTLPAPGKSTLPGGQSSHETGASGNDSAGNSDGASSAAGNMIAPGYYLDTNTGIAPAQTDRTPTFVTHSATPHVISFGSSDEVANSLKAGSLGYGDLQLLGNYQTDSKYEAKNVGARVSKDDYLAMDDEKQDEYWDAIEGKPGEDLLYEAVNGNYIALLELNRTHPAAAFDGLDKKYLNAPSELMYLSDEERAMFNFVYKTYGVETAKDLLNKLLDGLSLRQRLSIEEAAQKQADEHPVLSTIDTIVTSPFRGQIASVGMISDMLDDGKLTENAEYNYMNYQADAIRGKVSDKIEKETPFGKFGSLMYGVGTSIGDQAARYLASGGSSAISSIISASSAGASTVSNAKDLGLNDFQALSLGTIASFAEGYFEKHNLEDLLNADMTKDGVVKYVLKNSTNEAVEEMSTEALNTMADIIIAWDKGQMRTAVEAYKAQGLSEKDAIVKAFCDKLLEIGEAGASGFLSGGLMSGGIAGKSYITNYAKNAASSPVGIVPEGVRNLLNMTGSGKTDTKTDWKTALEELEPDDTQETVRPDIPVENRVLGPWISAAVDYYGKNGKLHPSDVEYILDDGKSRQMLTDLTGIEIPAEGGAARQQAVEQAVSILAGQSGQQLISGAKRTWYDLDQAAGPQAVNPMVEDLINNLPANNTDVATAQSQSRQDLQEIIDAQLSPNQNDPAPIDTTQNSVYDDKNTLGGTTYADAEQPGLSGAYEAGLPRGTGTERLRGTSPQQITVSGQASGEMDRGTHMGSESLEGEPGNGDFEVQLRDSPILRVSDSLAAAQQQSGIKTYPVRDTTSQPQVYADALTAGRNSDPANGWCVTPKSAQEIQEEGVRTFMNDAGTVGVGIAQNGDIVAVFKNRNGGPVRALDTMMPIAIEQGGDRLDCYGEGLVRTYENYGFIPVARVEFNSDPEIVNDGWDESKGHPYVYFMMHNGDTADQVASNIRKYPHATQEQLDSLPTYGKDDYDAAMAYRDSLMDERSTDLDVPPPSGPTDIGPAMPHSPGGSKVSKLYSNTYANATGEATQAIGQRAQELDPNIATYDPVTEKESFDEAISRAGSPEARSAEIDKLLNKDGWTGADNDTAYVILDKLRQEGDAVRFAALANKQRQMNTTAGQLVQSNAKYSRENLTKRTIDAFNTLSDMTERDVPQKYWKDQGFDAWKQQVGSTILDISNKLEQAAESGSVEDVRQIIRSLAQFRRTTAWFGLSSNLTKIAERGLQHIDADTAKAMAMAQLSQIPGDFQKRPIGQVIETIRVHNMLAALTTVNRNLFGNGAVGLVDATSDSTVGRGMDMILSKFTGKRTVGNDLTHGKTYLDAAGKAASIAALCVELDIPMDSDSRFTEGSTRTFSPRSGPVTRLLGAYEKAMKYALEVTDQFFSGGTAGAVDLSLQKLGDKANLTDAERQELAGQTGLRRTFKEDRMLSHAATGVKQGLDKIGNGHLGLGNALIPFARTGSNVTQTGADYTGVGLAVGFKEAIQLIRDVKSGAYKNGVKINPKTGKKTTLAQAQRRAATNMGRGLTGVGTISLFTAAALCGALRVHDDEDRDAKALDQSGNLSGAQLNLSAVWRGLSGGSTDWQNDDCVISMDFLEPFNSQMYLGYALSREEGMKDILKAYPGATFSSIWQAARDMPMIQGLSDAADLAGEGEFSEAFGQFVGDYATGFMPSWMRQSAQMIDPYYRDTTGENVWDKAGKQLVSRIPFLSQTLPKKVDGLGREQTRHDGDFMGFLNTFVNPGEIEHIKTGELEGFIDGVAQSSGDMAVYPRSTLPEQLTYKDENGDKHTYTLTGHDRETYQKAYGENVTRIYSELMDMEYFATLDPDDQATVMRNALSYADRAAESAIAGWNEEPKYITERPEGMSEAEAIVRNTLLGSSTAYAEFPIDTAVYVNTLVDAITPEKEGGNVRDIQKMEAVLADDSLEAYADALLREYLDEGPEARYDAALDAGYTDDEFVEAYRQYLDTEGEGKKTAVIRYMQREMNMGYVQAKRLYEILSSRTTSD